MARFIDSESDLDSTLNQFLPLTQNPPLFYPELVKQGTLALWCNLLSHENTDIAVDVIGVIQELTDDDVGQADEDEGDDDDEEGNRAESSRSAAKKIADGTPMAMAEFVDELVSFTGTQLSGSFSPHLVEHLLEQGVLALMISRQLNNSLLSLLVSNLSRLDESEDADSQGVYKILDIFENLFSFMPPLAEQVVADTGLMKWLVGRIQVKDFDSNKQYASQILAILVQSGREGVMKLADMEGLDVLLKVVSVSHTVFFELCDSTAKPRDRTHGEKSILQRIADPAVCSNTANQTQRQAKKSNSWKTSSIASAPCWLKRR